MFTATIFRIHLKTLKKVINTEYLWPIDYVNTHVRYDQTKMYKSIYRCAVALTVVSVVGLFSTCIAPLFKSKRELPHLIYHIIDIENSPYFEVMYFLLITYTSSLAFFVSGFEFVFYGAMSAIYCQMMMLNTLIKQINFEKIETLSDEEDSFRNLIRYVKHYSKILK